MKRFFFSLIALAAAAVSCTQSALLETPTLDGTPVSFSPYTGRTPITKASQVVGEDGLHSAGGFQVYGFLDDGSVYTGLDNVNVYMNNGLWTYDNIVYWPSNSDLSFVAYSANGINKGLDVSKDGFTFTVDENIDNQIDLLATAYQEKVKASSPNGVVSLTFHHLLSRVGFKVQTTTDKEITITDLSLKGRIYNQATLDFDKVKGANATPALETSGQRPEDPVEYVYVADGTTSFTANGAETPRVPRVGSEYLMIIPQTVLGNDNQAHDLSIEVKYVIEGSNTPKTSTVKLPVGFEFVAGKAYEFILQISTSSISFDVQEEEWDADGGTNTVGPIQPDSSDTGNGSGDDSESDPEAEEAKIDRDTNNEFGVTYEIISYDASTKTAVFKVYLTKMSWYNQYYNGGTLYEYKGIRLAYKTADGSWANKNPYKEDNSQWGTGGVVSEENVVVWNGFENDKEYLFYCIPYTLYNAKDLTIKSGTTYNQLRDRFASDFAKSFSTSESFSKLEPCDPSITLSIAESDISQNSVKVSGNYIEGISEKGYEEQIKEYGFCWMTGAGTPTLLNHYHSVANTGGVNPGDFTYTITDLNHYTEYSFCTYVVTASGKTCYSAPKTIRTKPELDDSDNNGGDWENGGDATIE